MTLFDLMPSIWLTLAFTLLLSYFISGRRVFLCGCGGAFFALCPAVFCLRIYVLISLFFAYLAVVFTASRINALKNDRFSYAVALTKIDADGGFILYKGSVRRAYTRDGLAVYRIGDVLRTELCSNGIIRADRI